MGRRAAAVAARIRGYQRRRARHFYLAPCADAETGGLILDGLTESDLAILDCYEEVPRLYRRERVRVVGADGTEIRCWVYMATAQLLAGAG